MKQGRVLRHWRKGLVPISSGFSIATSSRRQAEFAWDQPITSLPTKRMNGFVPSAPNEITV